MFAAFVTSTAIGASALAETLSAPKQCLGIPSSALVILAATQMQDWCDPRNRNLLQVDIFIKLANGTKGGYLFSALNIDCVRDANSIPSSVKSQFC
jgi:hypothetical protein